MQSWRREGIINRWQKSMTVLQDRNTSVFEDRVSTETGSSGISTQTIKHQLQSNYYTMTSSRGASSSGGSMHVSHYRETETTQVSCRGVTATTDRGTAVSCQKLSDKNRLSILLLSGDTHTHTHKQHTKPQCVCVYSYPALLLGLRIFNCTHED